MALHPLHVAMSIPADVRRVDMALRDLCNSGRLTLPPEVEKTRALLIEIENEAAEVPTPESARKALAGRIASGDVKVNDAKAVAEFAATSARRDLLMEARAAALSNYAHAVNDHADEILEEVEENLVRPALDTLRRAAEMTSEDDTVEALLQAGDTEAAMALAAARKPALLAALKKADSVRKAVTFTYDDRWEWFPSLALREIRGADHWLHLLRLGVPVNEFVAMHPTDHLPDVVVMPDAEDENLDD